MQHKQKTENRCIYDIYRLVSWEMIYIYIHKHFFYLFLYKYYIQFIYQHHSIMGTAIVPTACFHTIPEWLWTCNQQNEYLHHSRKDTRSTSVLNLRLCTNVIVMLLLGLHCNKLWVNVLKGQNSLPSAHILSCNKVQLKGTLNSG